MTTIIEPATASADTRRIISRWPLYADDEITAVAAVLKSGRVNALQHGDCCGAFEQGFAKFCDMPHGVSLANGTLALDLALRVFGIGPGDEVIVTPRSFVASASCIALAGARPVFADVDPDSQNITAETIAAVLTPRTRAVIAVHLAGWPCPMDEIMALAEKHGLKVIEDCAQAHGATINGRPAGSFGDAAAFSFCTDKIMSTGGEGGMLLLRDRAAWARAWSFKDHGKNRDTLVEPARGNSFRWLHDGIGTNYRLTEMQAAIGLKQLGKLPEWLAVRRRNAGILNDALAGLPVLRRTLPPANVGHAYYKYYAFIRPEHLRTGWDRDRIVAEANAAGVPCFSGTCPEIYRERAYTASGMVPAAPLPVARALGEESLMLPVDPTLDEPSMQTIGDVLKTVLIAASYGNQ